MRVHPGLLQELMAAQHEQQQQQQQQAADAHADAAQADAAAAPAPAPAATNPQEQQDAATMLLGLSDAHAAAAAEGLDEQAAAALQLQLQQQQQLQLQLLIAQAQAQQVSQAMAGEVRTVGAEGTSQEPQLLSLLQMADGSAAAIGADGTVDPNQTAMLAQLNLLQQLQAGQLPTMLPAGAQLFAAAPADGAAAVDGTDGDEPAAKRARVDDGAATGDADAAAAAAAGGAEHAGVDEDHAAAAALQIAALTPEQQAQLQAMMLAGDPNLMATLTGVGAAPGGEDGAVDGVSAPLLHGLVDPSGQPLQLQVGDAASAEQQLQQLMELQAQILQHGIETGELTPGPDGMLSPEQLAQLQLQTQLAQLQQVQMQQLLLQQLQMQQGDGEQQLMFGADGSAYALTAAPLEAPASSAEKGSSASGRGRAGGHQHSREPAVVRRHGAAPERTITRESLREVSWRRWDAAWLLHIAVMLNVKLLVLQFPMP